MNQVEKTMKVNLEEYDGIFPLADFALQMAEGMPDVNWDQRDFRVDIKKPEVKAVDHRLTLDTKVVVMDEIVGPFYEFNIHEVLNRKIPIGCIDLYVESVSSCLLSAILGDNAPAYSKKKVHLLQKIAEEYK